MYDYNFFLPYIARENASRTRTLVILIICALVIISLGSFFAATELISWSLQKDISSMKKFLSSKETVQKLQVIKDKQQKLDIMNKYSSAVKGISANIDARDKIRSSLLKTINKAVPRDISLDNLAFTQDAVQCQGKAPGWQRVAELEHNLNSLGIFSQVHVGAIQVATTGKNAVTFNLQCTLKDVIK